MALPPAYSGSPTPAQLVAQMRAIPPVARVLARLQHLLTNPNSSLEDIAQLIRLDAALMTRIIQISNSVWFRRGLPSKTIMEAVERVGFREVYRMVGVVASSAIIAQPLAAYKRTATEMWHESVTSAFAAEMLADRLGEDMASAYMSGLLHAIGRLPIDHFLQQGPAPRQLAEEGFPFDHSGAEYALLGFTQAEVAALMLTQWEFPAAVTLPIQYQYQPLEAPEVHDRMAAVLYGARLLRSVVCQKVVPAELKVDEEVLGVLHLNLDDVLGHLPELETQVARAVQMTSG